MLTFFDHGKTPSTTAMQSDDVLGSANVIATGDGDLVNASGHRDQLPRQYSLLSICSMALTIDNAWVAFGGSLSVAILNGGPPGIIYEFIAACVYYAFIAACIAELASSIPSSSGVYHWASITPGVKWGRVNGFFTGSLNFFGWLFALASITFIPANVAVQMYAIFNTDFVVEPWHSFVAYVLVIWICTAFVVFGNHLIPRLQQIGLVLVVIGGIVTIIVVAAMPKEYSSNEFVWTDFENATGWSDGIAFLTGVLNGAFTIGTPDAITHLAEEMPHPRTDLPKAILAQVGLGFIITFLYAIAILYSISDLDAVIASNGSFPLAEVYAQATGSMAGTFGLLLIVLLSVLICTIGTLLMVGRLLWTLARDNVTPFATTLSKVNEQLSCPVAATIACSILCTAFAAIQLGSKTAFTGLVGSFIILTTMSHLLAILPHLLTGRTNMPRGPFWMGKFGFLINGITCVMIVFFDVWFCWPYAFPVSIPLMNWNSVIFVAIVALTAFWWIVHGERNYPGPKIVRLYVGEK